MCTFAQGIGSSDNTRNIGPGECPPLTARINRPRAATAAAASSAMILAPRLAAASESASTSMFTGLMAVRWQPSGTNLATGRGPWGRARARMVSGPTFSTINLEHWLSRGLRLLGDGAARELLAGQTRSRSGLHPTGCLVREEHEALVRADHRGGERSPCSPVSEISDELIPALARVIPLQDDVSIGSLIASALLGVRGSDAPSQSQWPTLVPYALSTA